MKLKKAAAILIVIAIIAGWAVSAVGFGEGGSIADRMSLGLDMIGGVSVVLEAETDATGAELKSMWAKETAVTLYAQWEEAALPSSIDEPQDEEQPAAQPEGTEDEVQEPVAEPVTEESEEAEPEGEAA